jgi:protein O-mannosyl-transferase
MPQASRTRFLVLIYSALILSTLIVYWQVTDFGFVDYDDELYVSANPQVLHGLSLSGIRWAFGTTHAANWHPLTWLSLMLDSSLLGPHPAGMHFVNLLLHLANAILVFALLRRMTGGLWQSAFVAAAFALHPMHVESVAWIAERKDVLSTFFLLMTIWAYVAYVRGPSALRYLAILVAMACGLMSKPMLVTAPLILLLLDYWPLERIMPGGSAGSSPQTTLRRAIIEKIPLFVLVAVFCIITLVAQQSDGAIVNLSPFADRLANAFLAYGQYIRRFFWPGEMAAFYPLRDIPIWLAGVCAGALVAISILVILCGRGRKYLPAGWFWFLMTLVPVIGLVQVGKQAFADRYTYIPYIGLFIAVAWGAPELLARWRQAKTALAAVAVVALVAMAAVTWRQAGYWRDGLTLFTHAIEVAPDGDASWVNLGYAKGKQGRWREAIVDYSHAIQLAPTHAAAWYNRGIDYARLGCTTEAIADFQQAVRIKPDYAAAYSSLGSIYVGLHRWQEAIDACKMAVEADHDYAEGYYHMGMAYDGLGRTQDAIDAYRRAIATPADCSEAHNNLANILVLQGKYEESLFHYRQAMRLQPDRPGPMNNLAMIMATHPDVAGADIPEAIRLATRACELTNYKSAMMLGTLGAAYASAGRYDEAVRTTTKAMELAEQANQPQVREALNRRLALYVQGKPFTVPAPQPSEPNKP